MNAHTFERLRKIGMKEASKSDYKIKLGAVIFSKNRPLSTGFNTLKSHPELRKIFVHSTLHAECNAVFKVQNKDALKGSEIFVFRETKDGKMANSRPCAMCTTVLYNHGVKRCFWSISDFPFWESELVANMYAKIDKKECYETNCRKPKNPPQGKKGNNYEGR